MRRLGGRIGEGDFSEESNWAGQLAAQEERIKLAFLENQAAERETDNKLGGSGDWEGGEEGTKENSSTGSLTQLSLESGVESLSQQIVESLLSTLSAEG